MPKGINFIGQFYGCVGIGSHTRSFASALIDNIENVNLVPIHPNISNDNFGLTEKIKSHVKPLNPEYPTLVYWYPDTFPTLLVGAEACPKKFGYYIFEYTNIPKSYIEILNKMDMVFTPSEWGVDVLKNNGLTVPAHNIPGGVDHEIFNSKNRKPDTKKFRFIHVGKKEVRKGTAKIIQAFVKAFPNDRRVRLSLFIHNIHIPGFNSTEFVGGVLRDFEGGKYISAMSRIDTYDFVDDIVSVYNEHHAAVFATAAEGIGLPILESMACGIPTITAVNSAMIDYANDENSITIRDYQEEPVYDPHFFPVSGERGTWKAPSMDDVSNKMRWVYDNYDKAKEIGIRGEEWVSKNYSWDLSAKKFAKLL